MGELTPDLSVVVPTYRGASSLAELARRVAAVCEAQAITHELVVVNDASPDDTWTVLEALAAADPRVRGIELLANRGQPHATLCGLAAARGRLVATMDDDLQHPPEALPLLLDALSEHPEWDIVVGTWDFDQGRLRNLGTRVNAAVNGIAFGSPRGFHHTAFRLMRAPVVAAMLEHETRTPVVSALLWQTTSRIRNVRVPHHPRASGSSNYGLMLGLRLMLRSFFRATTMPLRFLSAFGISAAGLSFVVSIVYLGRWLVGVEPPPGWTSAFLATSFFGGATLFGVGLLGEYVGLLLDEVRHTPRWQVRHSTDEGPPGATPR